MNKFVTLILATLLSLGLSVSLTHAQGYGKQKVLYHINFDDPKRIKSALGNIQNHITAVGEKNIELRVVMHGPGLTLLTLAKQDMDIQDKVSNLKRQGIHFNVCKNTLVGKKLDFKTDLYDVVEQDIVPSGVAELAKLQGKGFAYVKP